jgi:hypothetical protein
MGPKKTVRKQAPVKNVAKRNSQKASVKKQPKKAQLKPVKKKQEEKVPQQKKAVQKVKLPAAEKQNPKLIYRKHPFTAVIQLFACDDVARLAETKKDTLGKASKRYMVEATRELKELGLL